MKVNIIKGEIMSLAFNYIHVDVHVDALGLEPRTPSARLTAAAAVGQV